jgi:UDP:flavonoid glycosyltransferase YjiC (YdhE family)
MITVAFYVSGHGFGHASRDVEVITVIADERPDVRVVARTSAAPRLFERSAHKPIELQPVETDTGVTQIDSLTIDVEETARRAARFYTTFDERVDAEAAVLRSVGASLVVGDVPPLAFAAAHRAGIPSVALANFTWDWIYDVYPEFERLAPGVAEIIRASYAKASLALRLPLHGGFEPMAHVTRDIPLIARRSRRSRAEVRRLLGLNAARPMVLASFGGFGLALPYDTIARASDFTLVVTDHENPADTSADGLKRFTRTALTERGLRYEDLVAASDIVVGKPGYGIVSECIANGTALLYTSRGRFAEYDQLVAEMPRVIRCGYLPREDLMAGRWSEAIHRVLAQQTRVEQLDVNGAEVAAREILQAL